MLAAFDALPPQKEMRELSFGGRRRDIVRARFYCRAPRVAARSGTRLPADAARAAEH